MYTLNLFSEKYKVKVMAGYYESNGTFAACLYTEDDEYFADITINIDMSFLYGDKTHAFIDTNNSPWLESFLQENELAMPAGIFGRNGYCTYPLYKFNVSKFKQISA